MAKKKQTTTKPRKLASKKAGPKKAASNAKQQELDTTYFLKLVIFLILGSQWIYIESLPEWQIPIPVGLTLGLIFATHEHFQVDRKIEYAVLLLAAFISFWLPFGLVIQL